MWDYDRIKQEAKDRGVQVTDLIALSPGNDAFYSGRPSDRTMAEWFARLWRKFGYQSGVHIRRVHYQIVSQDPPVTMPNGEAYQNTEKCWDFLSQAAKQARFLGYVDPAAFDDRRNPATVVNARLDAPEPNIFLDSNLYSTPKLPEFPDLPQLWVDGFEGRQRYMIEIWCEKSTMNDVLLPLCERYGANLQTGLGELSVTATLNAVQRVIRSGRPTRIFYVSDFDPAGQSMPVAVARKIEYFVRKAEEEDGQELDIRLQPVVLTADQVKTYRLPRTPIKDSEKRAGRFEERFGEGAVELDALEAVRPGTLVRILQNEIEPYYDRDLAERVRQAKRELQDALNEAQTRAAAPHQAEVDAVRARYEEFRAKVEAELGQIAAEQARLWRAIAERLRDEIPDLDDHPIPEAEESRQDVESAPLYDSSRGYVEQILAYKEFQGKDSQLVED